jgi:aryl-alcohol dehydrogenase-like predicted oxidoreductase
MLVALTWLLHRSPDILPIPSTSSVAHLCENLAAAQLTLSPQTLEELNSIAATAQKPGSHESKPRTMVASKRPQNRP